MSGFKNWNNDNNGKTGNNSNLLQGNNAGFINNNFQWKETRKELSTEKSSYCRFMHCIFICSF